MGVGPGAEVTGCHVIAGVFSGSQIGHVDVADAVDGDRTPRVEVAAGGRVQRRRDLSAEDLPVLQAVGVRYGNRRKQRLCVRVLWVAMKRITAVSCSEPHDWEAAGEFEIDNLASYVPYPIDMAAWDALSAPGCTQLANSAMSDEQKLPPGVEIRDAPIAMPFVDEWTDGHRAVVCGVGVGEAHDSDVVNVPVGPIAGTGSLTAGTWAPAL